MDLEPNQFQLDRESCLIPEHGETENERTLGEKLLGIQNYRLNVLGYNNENLNPIVDFYLLRTYSQQDLDSLSKDDQREIKQRVDQLLCRSRLKERELNPNDYFVDIGVEIKVHKTRSPGATAKKIKMAKLAGFPVRSHRRYKEYYPGPTNYYLTLSRAVQQLMQEKLISTGPKAIRGRTELMKSQAMEQRGHSLHITLGGIEMAPSGYLLTNALISTTWASSRERLLAAFHGTANWTAKQGAVVRRLPCELKGPKSTAIEIRPFEIKDLSGFDRTMRTAFFLGTALWANQRLSALASGSRARTFIKSIFHRVSPLDKRLSDIWREFENEVNGIFSQENLSLPTNHYDRDDYHKLAQAIDEVDGKPSKITLKIRTACTQARGKVARAFLDYHL